MSLSLPQLPVTLSAAAAPTAVAGPAEVSSTSPSSTSSPSILLPPSKASSSRYDYIKVRVHSGPHYHVLSRYLLARRLSFTLLPSSLCIHLALLIKKRCVDSQQVDIDHRQLERLIEDSLASHIPHPQQRRVVLDRWRMVARFTQRRWPLLLLLHGTAGSCKSVLARKLANRLSIPTVLHTAVVYQTATTLDPTLPPHPIHLTPNLTPTSLTALQHQRCRTVRDALQHDLMKCIADGRPMIVEGTDIDVSMYEGLGEEGGRGAGGGGEGGMGGGIVLAFLLRVEDGERRMLMQGAMCREEEMRREAGEPPLNLSEVEANVVELQRWMEQRAEEQRTRWQVMKERQAMLGDERSALPLVPLLIPVSLRSSSTAVASMHTAVLDCIGQHG